MKKVKDTIKDAATHSSGDALKLFSQCTEIQLMLRANFTHRNPINVTRKFYDVTFTSQGSKFQCLSHMLTVTNFFYQCMSFIFLCVILGIRY